MACASAPGTSALNWNGLLVEGDELALKTETMYRAVPFADASSLQWESVALVRITDWPGASACWVTCSGWEKVRPRLPPSVTCTPTVPLLVQGTVTVSEVAVAAVTVAV